MRTLFEDFLDSLDADELVAKNDDTAAELQKEYHGDYQWTFDFTTSEITKKKPKEWYISKMQTMVRLLKRALSICPYISDFDENFIIHFNRLYEERIIEDLGEGCVIDRRSDVSLQDILSGNTAGGKSNMMCMSIGINARVDTPAQLRRLMIALWRLFGNVLETSWKSGCRRKEISYIYYKDGNPKNKHINNMWQCDISHINALDWSTCKISFLNNMIESFRAFHPDMQRKDVSKQVAELFERVDNKNAIVKVHDVLSRAWSTGNNFRIEVEENGVVVYCPSEVNIGALERLTMDLDKLPFRVTFTGAQQVNIQYAFDPVDDPKYINQFFKQYMPGCKNIRLNLRFRSFKEMRKIDFTQLLPGLMVDYRVGDQTSKYQQFKKNHITVWVTN